MHPKVQMNHSDSKLDNPVWNSVRETHKMFSIQMGNIGFYDPDFCPFGGFTSEEGLADKIDEYAKRVASFYIVGQKPRYSNALLLNRELICNQMLLENPITVQDDKNIIRLGPENSDELQSLVNLVQPGYFKPRTSELGSYFGLYKNEQLIAVAGERMKMDGYTELSAVVTHPNYIKQGHAKKLVAFTANNIFSENSIPYLHVDTNNFHAINLYEKLGFKTRRKISFWNLSVNNHVQF